MELNNLVKITKKRLRRLGQGHASGRGKTSGRGTKGQKARRSISLFFEGGALPLIKRLPFRRGKGKNKVFKKRPVIINIKTLAFLKPNSVVDVKSLIAAKLVEDKEALEYGVKILGDGELNIPLTVNLPVSKNAKKKIEKAGGKAEL